MKKRLIRWTILLAIGFGAGSAIGFFQGKAENEINSGRITISPDDKKAVSKNMDKYSFSLIDHNGNEVTQDSYADTYKMVFFGFTFCPAVCPTELNKMTVILEELGDLAEKITPIFISIDPERDTPEIMKEYVAQFHPQLVGLTGSEEQINLTTKSFRAYAKKVTDSSMDDYMMDHSSFIYFLDQGNNLITMYPAKDSISKMAESIRKLITK